MSERGVYLDTPILAARAFGSPSLMAKVETFLDGRDVSISGYVVEQFRSTFVRASVLLYAVMRDERNVPDILDRLGRYPITHGDGDKARTILSDLMRAHRDNVEDMLETVERWLVEDELVGAATMSASMPDEIACQLCEKLTRDENGVFHLPRSCKLKPPKPCRIELFWKAPSRATHLRRLAVLNPAGHSTGVLRAIKAAGEVVDAGHLPRGERCTVALSDAVIVSETPASCDIATTNEKDFKPLVQSANEDRAVVNPCR